MARATFGGDAASAVWGTLSSGLGPLLTSLNGTSVTMWSAATGGSQYTDLLTFPGLVAITSVPAGVGGVLPTFQGPDGIATMYADAGAGIRVRLDSIGSLSYFAVGTAAQTFPAGTGGRIIATDTPVLNITSADLGDAICDQIDIRVRSTGDGVAVYHDGGASAATGITTGNVASFLSIIPFYIDEHGSGRDGTIPNPRWNRTGLWSIAQPPNRNDIAIKAESWSNVAAVQIYNQDPLYTQGNGRAMDIVDRGNDSTILIQKSLAIGSPTNAKTRQSTIKLQDLSTGGTDPALGTPGQQFGIDDGTGYRLEIDSIGTHRWSGFNASTFDVVLRRRTGGMLTMTGAVELEDPPAGGTGTPIDGMSKINATHALNFWCNSTLQLDIRNGQLGFFGTSASAAKTGWTPATGTATRTTFVTSTVTLSVLAEHVKALIDDLHQTAGYGLLRT